jgi:hypothetical protein
MGAHASLRRAHRNEEHQEVRFSFVDRKREILCRITRTTFVDHCGDPQSPDDCVAAVDQHSEMIVKLIRRKIAFGQFEPDGSIRIDTGDWRYAW